MTENIILKVSEINKEVPDINKLVDDELAEMFNLGKKKKKPKDKKEKKNDNEIKYYPLESPPTYTYSELLSNLYNKMGNLAIKENHKFMICQPVIVKISIKKVLWSNFNETCIAVNRSPEHLFLYIISELNTEASMNENKQLIIKGKYHAKNIENILRKYVYCFVQCNLCRSYETSIQKDTASRLQYLVCDSCKCTKTIPIIKKLINN
jgi:translation initiation factor 2 subunit 2